MAASRVCLIPMPAICIVPGEQRGAVEVNPRGHSLALLFWL